MPHKIHLRAGLVTFEVDFYEELTIKNGGKLSCDMACQALWHYCLCASRAFDRAKRNIVYEDEASIVFDLEIAQRLMQSISNLYGERIDKMTKFWPYVDAQVKALGGEEVLPEQFKLKSLVVRLN